MAIWGALGAAALGVGGAALGEKAKDKSELLREEPPERKYANTVLQLLSARALSGRKSAADLMEEARLRSQMERQLGQDSSEMMRRYGMMGVESPGMMNRLEEMRTGGITGIINAMNQANLERRRQALGMVGTLLNQNQPYEREKITEAPMKYKMLSSALPAAGGMLGGAKGSTGGTSNAINAAAATDKFLNTGSSAPTPSMVGSLLGQNSNTGSVINKGGVRLLGNQMKRGGLYRYDPYQYEGIQ